MDTVLTTTEILEILSKKQIDFLSEDLKEGAKGEWNHFFSKREQNGNLTSGSSGGSGGYAEFIFKEAAKSLFGVQVEKVEWKQQRNVDLQEAVLEVEGKKVLSFALAYGFRNIQNIVRKIKSGTCSYHYVEVMACPSGCLNGGGMIKNYKTREEQRDHLKKIESSYNEANIEFPSQNERVRLLYKEWIFGEPYSENARKHLHTTYKAIQKSDTNISLKW